MVGQSAALVIVGIALGGLLAEGSVRLYSSVTATWLARDIVSWDPLGVKVEPHGVLGYRQKPNSTFRYGNGTSATSNSMGFRGPEVTQHRIPNSLRIVLLGGSTTHGWGVNDDETIDAYMREIFTTWYPTRSLEVVNLGFDGYDSYQLLQRLESDGLPLSPDVVIVNSGINDVGNARFTRLTFGDPRTLLWESVLDRLRHEARRGGPTLWTRVKHYSYLARLPGLLRNRTRGSGPAGQGLNTPHPDAADYFQRNIERIAQLCADKGISIILSTPPSSLPVNFEPHATSQHSYWIKDALTTQVYRDTLSERLRTLASRLSHEGQSALFVTHRIPPNDFLDDAHLTPDGHRKIASDFVAAVMKVLGQGRYSLGAWQPQGQTTGWSRPVLSRSYLPQNDPCNVAGCSDSSSSNR